MAVDRCACRNITFAALKEMAEKDGLGLRELCDKAGCCRSCSMCEPYILEMLSTGKTQFPVKPHRQPPEQRERAAGKGQRGGNSRGTLGG